MKHFIERAMIMNQKVKYSLVHKACMTKEHCPGELLMNSCHQLTNEVSVKVDQVQIIH